MAFGSKVKKASPKKDKKAEKKSGGGSRPNLRDLYA